MQVSARHQNFEMRSIENFLSSFATQITHNFPQIGPFYTIYIIICLKCTQSVKIGSLHLWWILLNTTPTLIATLKCVQQACIRTPSGTKLLQIYPPFQICYIKSPYYSILLHVPSWQSLSKKKLHRKKKKQIHPKTNLLTSKQTKATTTTQQVYLQSMMQCHKLTFCICRCKEVVELKHKIIWK